MARSIWFLVLISIVSLCSHIAAQETVRITTGEYPPFLSEQFKHNGLWARICTAAFATVDIDTEIRFYPWKRAYIAAQKGEWDATLGWFHSPQREQHFYYSDPVFTDDFVFFHLAATPFQWETMNDLQGMTIGGTLEYTYTPEFLDAAQAGIFEIDYVPRDIQNFRKLLHGRIDAFPISSAVGYFLMQTQLSSEDAALIVHHPTPLRTDTTHLLFPKTLETGPRLLELFNQGLQQLRESGEYDLYVAEFQRGEYLP